MIHHYLIHECGMNPAEVALYLKGWEIRPFPSADKQMGEVAIRNNEIHISLSVTHRKRCFTRHMLRDFLAPLLHEKKFLVTRVYRGDERRLDFAKRMGFVAVRNDEKHTFLWMDTMPFERSKK